MLMIPWSSATKYGRGVGGANALARIASIGALGMLFSTMTRHTQLKERQSCGKSDQLSPSKSSPLISVKVVEAQATPCPRDKPTSPFHFSTLPCNDSSSIMFIDRIYRKLGWATSSIFLSCARTQRVSYRTLSQPSKQPFWQILHGDTILTWPKSKR
jgi:hypothetical protein